jgi:dTDP-4-dehydrorhamnose 3,5-epimerase
MAVRPLRVAHCLEFTPTAHGDDRGSFAEWFRQDELAEHTGRRFELRQANLSVSRRGVVRGIHFTDVPPGQAKYVIAVAGEIVDVAVDLRVGSPTFGEWEAVRLDDRDRRAVFLPEGVGHAFAVLSESATVCYLTTDLYTPERDRSLRPTDPRLAIDFGTPADELVLSPKDEAAPGLDELESAGLLPRWEDCLAVYEEAR